MFSLKRTMKLKRLAICGFLIACLLFMVVILFHCGPIGVRAGENRLLATRKLVNGDKLYILAERTDSWVEPYQVRLYRLNQNSNWFVNFLTFEDSFWWKCRFEGSETDGQIGIIVFNSKIAAYSLSNSEVKWLTRKRADSPSHLIGDEVTMPIPKIIAGKME
jgi:hypothetical protein